MTAGLYKLLSELFLEHHFGAQEKFGKRYDSVPNHNIKASLELKIWPYPT